MEVSVMELSSIPKGVEQVIDSPKLDATTIEKRMAKEAILLLIIVQNNTENFSHCSRSVTSLNEHRSATELLRHKPNRSSSGGGSREESKHSGGIMLLHDTTRDKWV